MPYFTSVAIIGWSREEEKANFEFSSKAFQSSHTGEVGLMVRYFLAILYNR